MDLSAALKSPRRTLPLRCCYMRVYHFCQRHCTQLAQLASQTVNTGDICDLCASGLCTGLANMPLLAT